MTIIYTDKTIINLGPQHPASHGVMRLQLELDGEIILHVNPEIGYLHRGTEKNCEYREYLKNAPYFDRFDYVAMMNQCQSYALVVEKLLNITIPYYAQLIRLLYCELGRILSHLLAISTHALDLGAMSAFCWAFEEREKILQLFETISGARMHTAFIRPGGVAHDFNQIWEFEEINDFIDQFVYRLDEIQLILDNPIFSSRLRNIGVISKQTVESYGLTGVLARASGFNRDIRKTRPYDASDSFKFFVPCTTYGDSFNRYNLRIFEIQESLQLIKQILNELYVLWKWERLGYLINKDTKNVSMFLTFLYKNFSKGLWKINDYKISPPTKWEMRTNMEACIHFFKLYSEGFHIKKGNSYVGIEAPKGEFGVHLTSSIRSVNRPWGLKVRGTSLYNIQVLNNLSYNYILADLVTLIGTCDLVLGESDR